jgi:hypothetical protein
MRVSVSFEVTDGQRRAVGWWADGGDDEFACFTSRQEKFRTAHEGRKSPRAEMQAFLHDFGYSGLESIEGDYDAWIALPLREELPETAAYPYEAPSGDLPPSEPPPEGVLDVEAFSVEEMPPTAYRPAAE